MIRGPSCSHRPISLVPGMMLIALAGVTFGALGNAVSPVGLAWQHDWSNDVWNRALSAGYTPLTPAQTREIAHGRDSLIVDARDPEAYAAGHIPGAVPVPWQMARAFLEMNAPKIPRDRPVLVYCSHAQCDAALVVADFFQAWRFTNISVLVAGFEGWQTEGLPVAEGMR